MALIKAKVLKPFEFEGATAKEGSEIVIQRKAAHEYIADGSIEQVGEVLDPAREEDRPLVDAWKEKHEPAPEAPEEVGSTPE